MRSKRTIEQDRRVLVLRRKGLKQYEIAFRLNLSIDQVKHANRRRLQRRASDTPD